MDFFIAGCGEGFLVNKNIFLSLFMGGLLGSVNHCAGMCTPFILAQTSQLGNSGTVLMRAVGSSLVFYHLGRMTTYIFMGVISSLILMPLVGTILGQFMMFALLFSAGVLFLLQGMAIQTHFKLPFWGMFARFSSLFSFEQSALHQFALGTALGFMPCGLVFAAILAVSSLSTPLEALVGMICFTLGTLPILLSVGFISNTLIHKYKKIYTKFIKTSMIFNGLVLMSLSLGKLI